jgi:hypothetical protein
MINGPNNHCESCACQSRRSGQGLTMQVFDAFTETRAVRLAGPIALMVPAKDAFMWLTESRVFEGEAL